MIDLILPSYSFALTYAQKLVADVADEQMCAQPVAGRVMNHAAFTIGHLAWANDNAMPRLGATPMLAEWKDLLGMGAQPLEDRSRYPAKEQLLQMLADAHGRLGEAARGASAEALAEPAPERMRHRFPTIGHWLAGLMTSHYSSHLGQLSAWRRAMGFPSVF